MSRRQDDFYWMRWEPQRWLSDNGLKMCSAAARGVWMDLLMHAWGSPVRGVLTGDVEKLCGFVPRSTPEMLRDVLAELEENRVFSRGSDFPESGLPGDAIVNRRMYRDWKLSKLRAAAGAKGGRAPAQAKSKNGVSNAKQNGKQNGKQNASCKVLSVSDLNQECASKPESEPEASKEQCTKQRSISISNSYSNSSCLDPAIEVECIEDVSHPLVGLRNGNGVRRDAGALAPGRLAPPFEEVEEDHGGVDGNGEEGDLRSLGARNAGPGRGPGGQLGADPDAGRGTFAQQEAGAGPSGSTPCPNSALSRGPSGKFEHATQVGVGVDGVGAGDGDLRSLGARGQETFAQQEETRAQREDPDASRGTRAQQSADAAWDLIEVRDDIEARWGALCAETEVRPFRSWTGKRKAALRQRWKERFWREHYQEAIARIGQSEFLRGYGSGGWRANMDWFLRPDTVTKLMEGHYQRVKTQFERGDDDFRF